jgi:methylphosphotriester-DNA--protein-cysteine methyltransferase
MIEHSKLTDPQTRSLIRAGVLNFGGNRRLKIYGSLNCRSGKKMHRKNRVFFTSTDEARNLGYRPCGHCMKKEYIIWKKNNGLV